MMMIEVRKRGGGGYDYIEGRREDEPNYRTKFEELVQCEVCGKYMGVFNGDDVDGSIMGICAACARKAGFKMK